MSDTVFYALKACGTDIEGALQRFSDNKALYISCLKAFPKDPTMELLRNAIINENWDDAFTAAHALKGLAGNMGFVPLYHATGELVILIRKGKMNDIEESVKQVTKCYNDILAALNQMTNITN